MQRPISQVTGKLASLLLIVLAASAPLSARAEEEEEEKASNRPAVPAAPVPSAEDEAAPPAKAKANAVPPVVPEAKPEAYEDKWTFFTNGRISNFFSWSKGDGMPQSTTYDPETDVPLHQVKTGTGGTGLAPQSTVNLTKADGSMSMAQVSTIDSMRMRSGFMGNQFVFGARRLLGDTMATAYVDVRTIVDSQSMKKYFQSYPDVREAFFELSGAWGSFLAGRSYVLFDRGAVVTDYLYLHGFGLGFPADLTSASGFPTAGQIGFGVLANGSGAGFVYGTPVIAGLKLSVGLYDPAMLTGSTIERTKYLRPEFELVANEPLGSLGRLHVYFNGGAQPNFEQNKTDAKVAWLYGVGYGARLELGPVHLAGGGHWGKGLGLAYPGLPSDAVYDEGSNLRFTDGYFGMLQLALGKFDINAGYGQTNVRMTTLDLTAVAGTSQPPFSWIHTQAGLSAALVFHARPWLHFAADYFRADSKWNLGERQLINFVNAGTTVTW